MKRLVSTAMLALGVAFVAAAYALPSANAPRGAVREGGVFRVSMGSESFDSVDPALAFLPLEWRLLEVTCAKLMNNPDKRAPSGLRVVPEVAADYPIISKDGKKYTFTLRRGFRFSNGAKLTGASFARAIKRVRELRSDGGLKYVQDVGGVVSRRSKLTIRLTRPIPDFTARLTMPFFCAVPPNLPADPEGAKEYASAGPYYVAEYRPGQRVVLRRNPYYGGKRPQHIDRFDVTLTSSPQVIERFERGRADYAAPIPPAFGAQARKLARKYARQGRLSFRPEADLLFFVLNAERRLFRGNARLRRAVNFAIDRAALVRELGYGVARPTDQYLPIGFPGFKNVQIYPFRPNLRKARVLARGRLRGGKAVLYVPTPLVALAQIAKVNLAKIGLDVEIKSFPIGGPYLNRLATRGEPFDIAFNRWFSDYNDPYQYVNLLVDGRRLGQPGNFNWSYFNSPKYNRQMDRASRLSGTARYRAYAKLDRKLVRYEAPMVAFAVGNQPTLVSARVDPRCKILRPGLDLAAVCLKR